MRSLLNTFLKGLFFTLPLLLTFGLLYWLFAVAENWLKTPIEWLLPSGWYIRGMGVVSAVGLIFGVGLLIQNGVTRYFLNAMENGLVRIPIVKTLYTSARDLIGFFSGDQQHKMNQVVTVTFEQGFQLIGFVTNENVTVGSTEGLTAVYFPMSYQLGGYLAYIPPERCEPLDMPVQQAMQQVLTAHIQQTPPGSTPPEPGESTPKKS